MELETVLREEGSIEVRLARAAEQSRKVSKEEEDAIRSWEGTRYKRRSQASKLHYIETTTD